MGYWVYNHKGLGMQIFYTEKSMRVSDFVREINRSGHGVHADTRQVGQSNTIPRPTHGGHVYHITANMVALFDVAERLSVEPEYLKKMESKLEKMEQ